MNIAGTLAHAISAPHHPMRGLWKEEIPFRFEFIRSENDVIAPVTSSAQFCGIKKRSKQGTYTHRAAIAKEGERQDRKKGRTSKKSQHVKTRRKS